jgi:hypothetical protein
MSRALIVTILIASAALADDTKSRSGNESTFEQQVLQYIANTIDWYRHLPTAQRIGSEPADLLFLESNRPIAAEIVRLSFELGKAVAAIEQQHVSIDHLESATNRDLRDLMAAKAKLDANIEDAMRELNSHDPATLPASHDESKKMHLQIADVRSRIELLKAMSANYEELIGFVRTLSAAPDGVTNMAIMVENLERTVPGVSDAAPSQTTAQTSASPAEPSRARHGIMAMISRASILSQKKQTIERATERTDTLIKCLQDVRTPLTEPIRKQLVTFSLDARSLDVLERQQLLLSQLLAEVRATSVPINALSKQQMLLNLYRSHLAERRSEIQREDLANWETLVRHLVVLGISVAMLLGTNFVVGRLVSWHVHEGDRRQIFLLGNRVLLWLIISAVILYAFAFDLNSLATFLGLLTAGLAVGLHNVLLAIGGYLVIVRKYHVKVGDKVQIGTVTGEVKNLRLLAVELNEIDTATGQGTGRVAFFSTSYVFAAPAIPFFRQFCGAAQAAASATGTGAAVGHQGSI